jgi:ATP-dependent Clp protease ATP-binding subunit ClpC
MRLENPLWQNGLRVSREHVVAQLTRIPETQETIQSQIAASLSNTVMGQDKAMQAIARRVTIANAGFNDPNRPLSSMFFLGPTGVGKTESARALADYMFKDPESDRLRIIDCQEYALPHMISRLIGSPPGYIDGEVKTVIDEDLLSGRNIIVFDEVEKAHPNFHKLLLGIMESGRLSIKDGSKLNFANSHIILTSNIGAEDMQQARKGNQRIGFEEIKNTETDDINEVGMHALRAFFRHTPEFLGRLDEVVVFEELKHEHYQEIFWKLIEQKNMQIEDRLGSGAPYIAATHEAQHHFLKLIDKRYGARELRSILDREVFLKVADLSLNYQLDGKGVVVDVENNQSIFYVNEVIPFEDNGYYLDIEVEFEMEEMYDPIESAIEEESITAARENLTGFLAKHKPPQT